MISGYISCELMLSVTLGSTSGLATWSKLFWFWSSKAAVMGLDCFCRRAVMWVGSSLSLLVLPHSEHLLAVLLCCFSRATMSPFFHLQSLLTLHRAFCPGDFWLPLTLNECLAFRGLQVLINGGRSAACQYAGRKGMFPFSQSYSLGDLQICF